MIVYKIRDTETGLYSDGGMYCDLGFGWGKNGKAWTSLVGLKNHLRMFWSHYTHGNSRICRVPSTWEVVELEVKEEECRAYPARNISLEPAKKKLSKKMGSAKEP
jgi:hypothetical protein